MNETTDMIDRQYKEQLLNTGIFRRVNASQYTCQCPFCNDNKRHMYVLIKMTDSTPVLYNCFKCNSHGKMNRKFLEFFGIDTITIPRTSHRKRIESSTKVSGTLKHVLVDEKDVTVGVCEYIQSRVGHYPNLDDLKKFQYVAKPDEYVREYLQLDKHVKYDGRCWFRITNGSIVGRRYVDDGVGHSWMKLHATNVIGRGLYKINAAVDLYKPINVCIAEGVMDVIGLYYNYPNENNVYIACLGRDYGAAMNHLVSLGIFGNSVNVKIFKDSDVDLNSIRIDQYLKMLFNRVDIYQNMMDHDYGVLPDKLEIQKCI